MGIQPCVYESQGAIWQSSFHYLGIEEQIQAVFIDKVHYVAKLFVFFFYHSMQLLVLVP